MLRVGNVCRVRGQKLLVSPYPLLSEQESYHPFFTGQPYGPATLSDCILELYAPQLFIHTPQGYIKTDDNVCLDAIELKEEGEVRIMACNTLKRQKWQVTTSGGLKHLMSGKCLDLPRKQGLASLVIKDCLDGSRSQKWNLEKVEWKGVYEV